MKLPETLLTGTLKKRYKRFLADVELDDGTSITVHCPNTGAMTGCDAPGSRVWLSISDNPRRKYAHTWELVQAKGGAMVSINTWRANRVVEEALNAGVVRELQGYKLVRSEVRHGESRFDFLVQDGPEPDCFVEVKSVTLAGGEGNGLFPDARSVRGTRHLRGLIDARESGFRAMNLFCVQRSDVQRVLPADEIDPDYGLALRDASAAGVELVGYSCVLSPTEITVRERIPVLLP